MAEDLVWCVISDKDDQRSLFIEKYGLIIPYVQPYVRRNFSLLNNEEKLSIKNFFKNFNTYKYNVPVPLLKTHAEDVFHILFSRNYPFSEKFPNLENIDNFIVGYFQEQNHEAYFNNTLYLYNCIRRLFTLVPLRILEESFPIESFTGSVSRPSTHYVSPSSPNRKENILLNSHFLSVKYINQCIGHNEYLKKLGDYGYTVIKDSQTNTINGQSSYTPQQSKEQTNTNIKENTNKESTDRMGTIENPKKKPEPSLDPKESNSVQDDELNTYLECDTRRCGLKRYDKGILTDVKRGHWDVFEKNSKKCPFIPRDPQKDIVSNGVIGIDFGTKSTVVVRQKGTNEIDALRIGSLNLSTNVSSYDYENPTIISCMNLDKFVDSYLSKDGRPDTSCDDVFVSYNALSDYNNCTSNFYAFFSDLKQWANSEKVDALVQDYNKVKYDLMDVCSKEERSLNPIEIYAYYIGMYINNMWSGIYLRYIMSFPVKFSKSAKELIRASFERGLKKSLPQSVIQNESLISKFSVKYELSEPAAFAVTALQNSNLKPENENESYLYGVFDFGGGTADFDFGIWRGASEDEYDKYNCDYVLECFGADSDPNLGGENILELLAYHIFKNNKEMAETKQICCAKPYGEKDFPGSEILANTSMGAYRNLTILKEKLRPLWHQDENWRSIYASDDEDSSGSISVQLVNTSGELTPDCCFVFNIDELINLIKKRIEKGVDTFFKCLLKLMHDNSKAREASEDIHIFLAGNSSKSVFVKEIFNEKIAELDKIVAQYQSPECDYEDEDSSDRTNFSSRLKLVMPPEGDCALPNSPNAKTGVAFGLVNSRKGSKIFVIKSNEYEADSETRFKYYLGSDRRGKFECKLKPIEYVDGIPVSAYERSWKKLQGAGMGVARIYYTPDPSADAENSANKLPIENVQFKEVEFDPDEDKFLFVRAVGPSQIEYAIASCPDDINDSSLYKVFLTE